MTAPSRIKRHCSQCGTMQRIPHTAVGRKIVCNSCRSLGMETAFILKEASLQCKTCGSLLFTLHEAGENRVVCSRCELEWRIAFELIPVPQTIPSVPAQTLPDSPHDFHLINETTSDGGQLPGIIPSIDRQILIWYSKSSKYFGCPCGKLSRYSRLELKNCTILCCYACGLSTTENGLAIPALKCFTCVDELIVQCLKCGTWLRGKETETVTCHACSHKTEFPACSQKGVTALQHRGSVSLPPSTTPDSTGFCDICGRTLKTRLFTCSICDPRGI